MPNLHNTLFFKQCINALDRGERVRAAGDFRRILREAADNDHTTFTTQRVIQLNIAIRGHPTRVDAVFIKATGVTSHLGTASGGSGQGYRERRMPDTVKNWEGTEVSTSVGGFQHDLFLLPKPFTATSVVINFTGRSPRIYEIMLLELGLAIDANADFMAIDTDYVDRSAVFYNSPGGRVQRGKPIGYERDKWEVNLVVKVVPGKTSLASVEEFLWWRGQNKNFVFAQEPSRYPARVYPAAFLGDKVPVRLRTDNKNDGEIMNIRIGEQ